MMMRHYMRPAHRLQVVEKLYMHVWMVLLLTAVIHWVPEMEQAGAGISTSQGGFSVAGGRKVRLEWSKVYAWCQAGPPACLLGNSRMVAVVVMSKVLRLPECILLLMPAAQDG